MIEKLLRTDNDWSSLVLRLMLGLVFFPHGAQKVLGWFGGHGLAGTLGFFTETMGIPLALALLVIAAEFLGSLGLITGLLTRVGAFGIFCVMLGAIFLVHLPNGFFMNWGGNQAGEGFEYHLLAIAIAVALMVKGGGRWSLDGLIARRR
jgi:putative oxidoreductase